MKSVEICITDPYLWVHKLNGPGMRKTFPYHDGITGKSKARRKRGVSSLDELFKGDGMVPDRIVDLKETQLHIPFG